MTNIHRIRYHLPTDQINRLIYHQIFDSRQIESLVQDPAEKPTVKKAPAPKTKVAAKPKNRRRVKTCESVTLKSRSPMYNNVGTKLVGNNPILLCRFPCQDFDLPPFQSSSGRSPSSTYNHSNNTVSVAIGMLLKDAEKFYVAICSDTILRMKSPTNPSLLGVNVGKGIQVKLRLRRSNRDTDFIPYDQVLDTMLHELCHNAHGPHNSDFYKLWDELRKECEDLMSKGVTGTGEGFDRQGKRLGGFTRQPPLSSLRQTALAAAQKRARLDSLLPSGPQRLGGDSTIMGALSPIQAAAMAAERRYQDEIWCGSQAYENFEEGGNSTDDLQNVEHKQPSPKKSRNVNVNSPSEQLPSRHSRSSFIDLSNETSTSSKGDVKSLKRTRETDSSSALHSLGCRPETSFVDLSTDAISIGSKPNYNICNTDENSVWECGSCTLLNPPLAPLCELCGAHKPKDKTNCKFWLCKFCTLENNVKLENCSACGQWRYSHGPLVSSHTPNTGT